MKLFICTSGKTLNITLFNDLFVYTLKREGNNDHSKTLMPLIDEVLVKNSLSLKDIDEILVSYGPGSYTGVRIGVVVAKTLATFNDIKLSCVSSLEALASSEEGVIAAFIPAKKGFVFAGVYSNLDNKMTCIVKDSFLSEEEFNNIASKNNAKIVGDGSNINPLILNKIEANKYTLSPNYIREWND